MKQFLLYLFCISISFSAVAQPPGDAQNIRRQRIKALYIAYVQDQLNFSPVEAQQFWPIHEQYEAEVMAINRSPLNELDRQQRLLDAKRKYQPQFERVIGSERANRFYPVSDRFLDKLTDRFKQMKQERKAEKEDGVIRQGGERFRRGGGMGGRRENMIPPKSN